MFWYRSRAYGPDEGHLPSTDVHLRNEGDLGVYEADGKFESETIVGQGLGDVRHTEIGEPRFGNTESFSTDRLSHYAGRKGRGNSEGPQQAGHSPSARKHGA
jgi:hypothetical protein